MIIGCLDETEHPQHRGDTSRRIRAWMVDENPVWVLDAPSGPIWGSDPRFNGILREYGLDPTLLKRTTLGEASAVLVYGREDDATDWTSYPFEIASSLGRGNQDGYPECAISRPFPPLVDSMVEFAAGRRTGLLPPPRLRDVEEEAAVNRGLLRFFTAVLSDSELADELPRVVCQQCMVEASSLRTVAECQNSTRADPSDEARREQAVAQAINQGDTEGHAAERGRAKLIPCQLGFIDSIDWSGEWDPGEVPPGGRALKAYERKLRRYIAKERFDDLNVRVEFRDYDEGGADISVYVRYLARSFEDFVQQTKGLLCYVPDGHAFDALFNMNDRYVITEEDFDDLDNLLPEVRERLFSPQKASCETREG
jgi:hypothetical protein